MLPPSEGKARPGSRRAPVDLAKLAFPQLTPQREQLLDVLGDLRRAPAAPAHQVYTGVLFQQLRLGELPGRARRRVLIASGLWGMLRADDRIPAYKLPINEPLAGIGALPAFWRAPLREALPDDGLIVDLRSGAYASAWRPRRAAVVAVHGLAEHADGRRSVISHMAKRVRGDVARILLTAPGARPRRPSDVLELVRAAGLRAELDGARLDVIEAA
jgi:hypothetical protein